ncbi:cell division protein [Altererythrobacter aquaemixtae]|uniref:Cell division protein n=1 Tax=Pontixanthobacter aquaemixtae TaxID=1958940 RepID=A0A844ZLA7_9SPHN|nr:cell division protein [Pontixanthobacter aquaemixtae]
MGRKTARGLIPFRGERAAQLVPQARLAGPMPWVIAIMVTLTVIAAAGGLVLNNVASTARAELASGATVQILDASPSERGRQAQAAVVLLQDHPAVASIRRVPDEELSELLEPWLGVGVDNEAVPVPALIDVRLKEGVTEQALGDLRHDLAGTAPAARIDAQSSWLAPVFSAIESLQWLSAALVILLGLTSAAAVWLAARSALGTNQDTIEIVHLLGGTDTQIAQIFERSIGFDATLGGAVGLGLGLITILFLGQEFGALGSGMMAGGGLNWLDWILIALIPLLGVVIAMLTARFTVVAALRRML